MPVLGLAPGEKVVAISLPAGSADFGIRPGLALGVTAGYYYYLTHLGARATWTLATPRPGLTTGVIVGAGGGSTTFDRASGYGYLLGAAVAQQTWGWCILRVTLGPGVVVQPRLVTDTPWGAGPLLGTALDYGLVPMIGLEFAIPLGESSELTVGGNALVGWRGRW